MATSIYWYDGDDLLVRWRRFIWYDEGLIGTTATTLTSRARLVWRALDGDALDVTKSGRVITRPPALERARAERSGELPDENPAVEFTPAPLLIAPELRARGGKRVPRGRVYNAPAPLVVIEEHIFALSRREKGDS